MAAEGATKVVKPEPVAVPGMPPANGAATAGGDPAANGATAVLSDAVSHSDANPKAPAQDANVQQAAAYYAQMAQQPNLYAQMWANPVSVTLVQTGQRSTASSQRSTFSSV